MDAARFWALIDESRELAEGEDAASRADSQAEHLTELLKQRSTPEIEDFERLFMELMNESYRSSPARWSCNRRSSSSRRAPSTFG
jgi:hypothetical protein